MPEAILQQKIFPYDGAFDATKHPLLISPKDVVDSNNTVYTTYSTKKLRPGITAAFPSRWPGNRKILAGIDFWRLGRQWVVFYDGRQIVAYDVAADKYEDIGQDFVVPTDEVVHFIAFQGLLIVTFGDGVTSPKAWPGSGSLVDLHSTAPMAPFAMVWLNRLWMPDPSVMGRMLYSQTGDVVFTGGDSGAIDLDPNDGDPDGITAIFPPFFGNLYVTKRFSTYRIKPVIIADGTLVFSELKITDGVGCNSHGAVAAGTQNIFWTDDEGVHYFVATDKASEVDGEDFSIQIQTLWRDETNFKRSKFMRGIYDKGLKSYLLLYPSESSSFANEAWGYSITAKKWYRWSDYGQTCLFRYVDRSSKKLRTIVGSSKGDLGYIDSTVTQDYGKPFNLSLQSGIVCPGGTPNESFAFNSIIPIFVPQLGGKFTISYKIDGNFIEALEFSMDAALSGGELGVDFTTGSTTLGGVPQVVTEVRSIKGYGMMYEFFLEFEGLNEEGIGFEFLGLLFDVDKVTKVTGRTVA